MFCVGCNYSCTNFTCGLAKPVELKACIAFQPFMLMPLRILMLVYLISVGREIPGVEGDQWVTFQLINRWVSARKM